MGRAFDALAAECAHLKLGPARRREVQDGAALRLAQCTPVLDRPVGGAAAWLLRCPLEEEVLSAEKAARSVYRKELQSIEWRIMGQLEAPAAPAPVAPPAPLARPRANWPWRGGWRRRAPGWRY
eukprot:scaffold1.g5853.t1